MLRLSRREIVCALLLAMGPARLFAAAKRPPPPPPPLRMETLTRVLALEDARSLGQGELERDLRSPDRSIRRRAALAAGRIADPKVTPTLIELMNDQEPEVRQMAAFALGLIGDRQAVDRLRASLKDSDATVRARSAEALGRLGDKRAAADLVAFIQGAIPHGAALVTVRGDDAGSVSDPWVELRLGLFALAALKDGPAAEAVLLVGGKPRFDWWAATWTAMRLELPSLEPVLKAAAASDDPLARAIAARGLGALKDKDTFETIAKLVRDPDETVSAAALKALGTLGDAKGTAVAVSMLAAPNLVLKREALRSLAFLPGDRALRARLVPLVGAKEAWIRGPALRALARADSDEFALVLSGLDPDPDWTVRADLAAALGDVGGEIGASLLLTMLKDPDVRVLPAVLEALRVARGSDATDTLRRHLEHPDFAVRVAAVEGLVAQGAQGLSDAFGAAYRSALPETEPDVRLALVAAFAAQKDAKGQALLEQAAKSDPSRVVRTRAIAALRAAGGASASVPEPGPEDVRRPLADYRLAMEPYDSVPGLELYSPRAIVHTRRGRIEILLDVVETPLTTLSFMDLARRGFYDGLTFHRVEPSFVVQGGCPRGDGNGGPGYAIRCEIGQRPYGRGAVGMAMSGKDTGGSQFFITQSAQPHLDGGYALFGRVTGGMDVVDQIRPGDVIEHIEIWTGR
jgi:cyclophilin family peptidyl-prolyl cis-trans isomerase/HEAT repeat protein